MHTIFGQRAFSNFSQPEEPARDTLDTVDVARWKLRLLSLHRDDPHEVIPP